MLADIARFNERISRARDGLSKLPVSVSIYSECNRVMAARRKLLFEISHVKTMVGYARDALSEIK